MGPVIFLDLEFNSGMYGERLEEILQIGAVRCDRLGGPITDTFNVFIRPKVHKRLSPGARVLPELEASLESDISFPEALELFLDWCAGETRFAEWGRDDFKILGRNAVYWGIDMKLPESYLDIQAAFGKTLGETNVFPLYHAAEYCRVPDTFTFHNALNDALYTCLVAGFVTEKAARESMCEITYKDTHPDFKPKPAKKNQIRMGPFETREDALNNLGSRRAVCPACRHVARVGEWYSGGGDIFFGQAICPKHGPILRKLRLARQPDGAYWTYNDTLPVNPSNLGRLRAAQNGERVVCLRKRRRRRKRRR